MGLVFTDKIFAKLLKDNDISYKEAGAILEVGEATVSRWATEPLRKVKKKDLRKINEVFGDYLMAKYGDILDINADTTVAVNNNFTNNIIENSEVTAFSNGVPVGKYFHKQINFLEQKIDILENQISDLKSDLQKKDERIDQLLSLLTKLSD